MGPNPVRLVSFYKGEKFEQRHTGGMPCDDRDDDRRGDRSNIAVSQGRPRIDDHHLGIGKEAF